MVKLAAILLQRKMVKLEAPAKNSQVSSNFVAAINGQVSSHSKKKLSSNQRKTVKLAAKNGQLSSNYAASSKFAASNKIAASSNFVVSTKLILASSKIVVSIKIAASI